ncbi:MAG: thiolase family protein [Elusimicrobia bacterium]|nr:thiolase family protein [Elusimicrobiota bacterium]
MPDAFLISGARTPFCAWSRGRRGDGSRGGALAALDPFELGGAALRGALERCGPGAGAPERVVWANMYQDGPHGCYGARYAAWKAGLPPSVPALTLNLACGGGLSAVAEAAQDVASGEARSVLAGGADCPSRLAKEVFAPSFTDLQCGLPIAATVEPLAAAAGFTREDLDAYALESHRRAVAARERLAEEVVPAGGAGADDGPSQGLTAGELAAAKPTAPGGLVTARNTHSVADGGAAVLLAGAAWAAERGMTPLCRVAASAYAGVPPERMGVASVPAVRAALARAGWEAPAVDLWEVNETFAAQALLDARELGLDLAKVNVNGGAIALGHPFAASGARLVLGLALELRRRGLRRGGAAVCVGGGLGVCVLLEAC